MQEYSTIAAVDLGSNSFRLQVVRVVDDQLYPLDSLKETVRLGGGLMADKNLDAQAQERALAALKRFSERLAGMPRQTVRVVGTNALRVAKNAGPFLRRAETTLGFPIEIIPGREEARLIYLGVAHSLPLASHNRLVVDVGGGSTELIIGNKMKPKAMESLYMGCVSFTTRYFPEGRIEKKAMKQAELAARAQVQTIAARYEKEGWKEAVGSSGTARSIAEILAKSGQAERGITAEGLAWLREELLTAGDLRKLSLAGLREDRDVIPGTAAVYGLQDLAGLAGDVVYGTPDVDVARAHGQDGVVIIALRRSRPGEVVSGATCGSPSLAAVRGFEDRAERPVEKRSRSVGGRGIESGASNDTELDRAFIGAIDLTDGELARFASIRTAARGSDSHVDRRRCVDDAARQ